MALLFCPKIGDSDFGQGKFVKSLSYKPVLNLRFDDEKLNQIPKDHDKTCYLFIFLSYKS